MCLKMVFDCVQGNSQARGCQECQLGKTNPSGSEEHKAKPVWLNKGQVGFLLDMQLKQESRKTPYPSFPQHSRENGVLI